MQFIAYSFLNNIVYYTSDISTIKINANSINLNKILMCCMPKTLKYFMNNEKVNFLGCKYIYSQRTILNCMKKI